MLQPLVLNFLGLLVEFLSMGVVSCQDHHDGESEKTRQHALQGEMPAKERRPSSRSQLPLVSSAAGRIKGLAGSPRPGLRQLLF